MSGSDIRHEFVRTQPVGGALGTLLVAGRIHNGIGVETGGHLRRFGGFALMAVVRGSGTYRDQGHDGRPGRAAPLALGPGSVVTVLPGHPHWYGTADGERWDEIYVTFEGPVFELLRADGVVDAAVPVAVAPKTDPRRWVDAIESIVGPDELSVAERLGALVALLGRIATDRPSPAGESAPDWLTAARLFLDTDLDQHRSIAAVAALVHVHPDTLTRRFRHVYGESPRTYRSRRRIDAARQLLRYSPQLTNREVADLCGFADEFHFSHRFRAQTGESPRAFRQRIAADVNRPDRSAGAPSGAAPPAAG